jgi:hypothetical protein
VGVGEVTPGYAIRADLGDVRVVLDWGASRRVVLEGDWEDRSVARRAVNAVLRREALH